MKTEEMAKWMTLTKLQKYRLEQGLEQCEVLKENGFEWFAKLEIMAQTQGHPNMWDISNEDIEDFKLIDEELNI
jgi:hypothetical protein